MSTLTRREVVGIGAAAGVAALGVSQAPAQSRTGRRVTIEARPEPITIDTATTAVIVVDMQNDFGSKGGMFERAGIDISGIQKAVPPTARVLDSARRAGVKTVLSQDGVPAGSVRPGNIGLGQPSSALAAWCRPARYGARRNAVHDEHLRRVDGPRCDVQGLFVRPPRGLHERADR